jgi:hypothetical protein
MRHCIIGSGWDGTETITLSVAASYTIILSSSR